MRKNLITFIFLQFIGIYFSNAQSKLDCNTLKSKIESAFKESKSIRFKIDADSLKFALNYEKDSVGNSHLIFNKSSEDIRYAFIRIKSKLYSSTKLGEWSDTIPNKFPYYYWNNIYSSAIKVFQNDLNTCESTREVNITGTRYICHLFLIEKDSFKVWINKETGKIERLYGENKKIGADMYWYFYLPFEIVAPNEENKKVYGFGYRNFPPSYSFSEKHDGTEPVYESVDKLPEFQNGFNALYQFLGNNTKYSDSARRNGIEGTVYCGFVIEKDGSVSNIHIIKGIGSDCDEETQRVIKKSNGKWTAGEHNGQKVRVAYTLPVKFKLE
jgi:TonB family protein